MPGIKIFRYSAIQIFRYYKRCSLQSKRLHVCTAARDRGPAAELPTKENPKSRPITLRWETQHVSNELEAWYGALHPKWTEEEYETGDFFPFLYIEVSSDFIVSSWAILFVE